MYLRNYTWKLEEEKRYTGTGTKEGPKQDEPKQTQMKTYRN